MSRSSSVASLSNIHSSREKRRPRRRGGVKKDRSLSRETGRYYRNNSPDRYRNQRRQSDENVYRPISRDRNKGCYGFHRNSSRDSSRDRDPKMELLDWRRGGDQEKDWRRDREKVKEPEKEDSIRWREEKKMESAPHYESSNQNSQNYNQRGFIQLQQPPPVHQQHPPQRQLYDPSNPSKPIIVNFRNSRINNAVTRFVLCFKNF